MSKVKLTIDGIAVEVEAGSTILQAAEELGIYIPTLCYHPDQEVKANCRICVVEIVGQKLLQAACSYQVYDGMAVLTRSKRVRNTRENILELMLSRHAQDCLHCERSGNCELKNVSEEIHFTRDPRFDYISRSENIDESSPSITRNPEKCIACGRCEYVCTKIQEVYALSKTGRSNHVGFEPAYGKSLADSACVNCGQCVQACPTGALTVNDDTQAAWLALDDPQKTVVAQIAPAVRINLAEALGEAPGTISTGRLVTALKRLGFDVVFDTDFTADLTIMEEGTELLSRITSGGTLPMITSCSPGWIKFCETYYPDLLPNLSSCKSPQAMFGALIKTYYAAQINKDPNDIYSVSVMPCTAKKFEAQRPEMGRDGYRDVDVVLTVQEIARMIRSAGINFASLPDTPFDAPFGLGSGAGEIFGATGGVMEAALRSVYEIVTGNTLENLDFVTVRGFDGIKEAAVMVGDLEVKVAVAHGLGNARKLMDAIREGKANYHFIEIMACPGGCIGGGGNPIKDWRKMDYRLEAVYQEDLNMPLRKSHENQYVKQLYDDFLGEPNGHKSHELLHTHYIDRSSILK
ncbi:MAG: NADH-dependent [FeFe] hydrogenase, group A6 [Eubacteriaceae bacterium]|nr:NADH-dependent [FeFe] hydrogenase, group A6 [Eubacteriaceae bacterium]